MVGKKEGFMPWTEIVIAICSIITIIGSTVWILIKELTAMRKEMSEEFKAIRTDLRNLDSRVSRIEGYITGRDSCRNGTESK
jgi:hypothetical protein